MGYTHLIRLIGIVEMGGVVLDMKALTRVMKYEKNAWKFKPTMFSNRISSGTSSLPSSRLCYFELNRGGEDRMRTQRVLGYVMVEV